MYQQEIKMYLNRYVKGIAFIPTYLVVVLVLSQVNLLLMLAVMGLVLYVTDKMYLSIFTRGLGWVKSSLIYMAILLFQLALLFLLFGLSK